MTKKKNIKNQTKEVNNNFQYRMTKDSFQSIVATRSGEDKGMNPYDYVVKYINDVYGLKGVCTKVTVI